MAMEPMQCLAAAEQNYRRVRLHAQRFIETLQGLGGTHERQQGIADVAQRCRLSTRGS
jgi:hypothetical protein